MRSTDLQDLLSSVLGVDAQVVDQWASHLNGNRGGARFCFLGAGPHRGGTWKLLNRLDVFADKSGQYFSTGGLGLQVPIAQLPQTGRRGCNCWFACLNPVVDLLLMPEAGCLADPFNTVPEKKVFNAGSIQ